MTCKRQLNVILIFNPFMTDHNSEKNWMKQNVLNGLNLVLKIFSAARSSNTYIFISTPIKVLLWQHVVAWQEHMIIMKILSSISGRNCVPSVESGLTRISWVAWFHRQSMNSWYWKSKLSVSIDDFRDWLSLKRFQRTTVFRLSLFFLLVAGYRFSLNYPIFLHQNLLYAL